MDFLFVSLFFYGKDSGYRALQSRHGAAGQRSARIAGAHARERLARLLFRRGEHWYNFQGLRFYKQKFDPEWVPRYMAYQSAWEWPVAIANVSALIAGGWGNVMRGKTTAERGRERDGKQLSRSSGEISNSGERH